MRGPFIYLAGPIYGTTVAEANDWRDNMTTRLAPHGIRCISPLRCEPLHGTTYDLSYQDPSFGAPKAILAKNFLDLRTCDFTLAYFPTPKDPTAQRSAGTIGELSWAFALQKPCAVVSDDPFIARHPFTSCQPSWPILPSLDEAERLIVGLYGDYAE